MLARISPLPRGETLEKAARQSLLYHPEQPLPGHRAVSGDDHSGCTAAYSLAAERPLWSKQPFALSGVIGSAPASPGTRAERPVVGGAPKSAPGVPLPTRTVAAGTAKVEPDVG